MIPIEECEFSVRTANCLKNDDIQSLSDLEPLSEAELLRLPGFGRKSLNEVKERLALHHMHLLGDDDYVLAKPDDVKNIEEQIEASEKRLGLLRERRKHLIDLDNERNRKRTLGEERLQMAFELRQEGCTFTEIGIRIGGVTGGRAGQIYEKALRTFGSPNRRGMPLYKEARAAIDAEREQKAAERLAEMEAHWPGNAAASMAWPIPGQAFVVRDYAAGPLAGESLLCTSRRDNYVMFEHGGTRHVTWADMCSRPNL